MNYTGSDCLEQLRNGSFSWRYLVPNSLSGRNTPLDLSQSVSSTITENEETQVTHRSPVARSKRARTKRCRRSSFGPRHSFPPLCEPENLSTYHLFPPLCEPKNSSTSRIIKKRKKMVQPTYPMEENDGSTKCTHCGVTDTPQWRAGPLGPRTLCNACGVRYKSGRLLPEYRPAASPYFSPSLHSNSHKKVLQMRNKVDNVHYVGNSSTETELASPNIPEKVPWISNKPVHECYIDETTDNTPLASSESELVPSFGSNSHESVDEEENYGYWSNEIDRDNPMELIPNIDPLYGLDLSEYYLGNHSLDFTF